MNGLGQRSAGTDATVRRASYMKTASSTTTLTFIDHPRPFRVLPRSPHHRSDRSSKPSPDASSTTGSSGRLLSGLRRSISTGSQPLPPQPRRRRLSRPSDLLLRVRVRRFRCVNAPAARAGRSPNPCPASPGAGLARPIACVLAPRHRPGAGRQSGSAHGDPDRHAGRRARPCCAASATPLEALPPTRVLGVDDWAWRKGQRYGTILCDLERDAGSTCCPTARPRPWRPGCTNHPAVEIVVRDRAGAYAERSRQGAPQAIQVADRWRVT